MDPEAREHKFDPLKLEKTGLHHDVVNLFASIVSYVEDPDSQEYALEEIGKGPLATYEDYFRERNPDAEEIIRRSDPAQVKAFNEAVGEFNRDRARMIKEKDFNTIKTHLQRLESLIRGQ
jgi:hypothetical protein